MTRNDYLLSLRGSLTRMYPGRHCCAVQYDVGRVLGAGSFGVVRECVEKATGRKYAVKTITKAPKRGAPTPRYNTLNMLVQQHTSDANLTGCGHRCTLGASVERQRGSSSQQLA